MPNRWTFEAVDKDGKPVESAPGKTTFLFAGPGNPRDLIALATLYFNNKRLDAVRFGLPDPGYRLVVESVKPAPDLDPFAELDPKVPTGAAPLELPTDAAVRAAHEAHIAEHDRD